MSLFRRTKSSGSDDDFPSKTEAPSLPSKSKKAPAKNKAAAKTKAAPASAPLSKAAPMSKAAPVYATSSAYGVTAADENDDDLLPAKVEEEESEAPDFNGAYGAVAQKKTATKQAAQNGLAESAQAIQENLRFRHAYEAAVCNGDPQEWGWCKLMVIGQGAAGKTSTVRSLLGLPPRTEWESTVGVDLTVTSADDWAERDRKETDFNLMLHKAAAEILRKERETQDFMRPERRKSTRGLGGLRSLLPGGRKSARKSGARKSGAGALPEFALTEEEEGADPLSGYNSPLVPTDDVARSINVKWAKKLASAEDTPLRFSIWDYGGQDVFYALHHIFLTRYGVYLLVFDMRQVLDDPEEALGYLRFWLNSVRLHAPTAAVVMIGTYGDAVADPADHRRIEQTLLGSLKAGLMHQLVLNAAQQLSFFPMDNAKNCPSRGDVLRRVIEARASAEPFVKQKVSLRWIKVLTDLVEDDGTTYARLKPVQDLAAGYGIGRAETGRMLQFFNEIGALVHLDATENLRGVVITQPQWLLDKLSSVIADEIHVQALYYDPEMRARGLSPDFARLRESGIASFRLLSYLWGDEQADFLVDFMQSTLLLSPWRFGDAADESGDGRLFLVTSLLRDRSGGNGGERGPAEVAAAAREADEHEADAAFFRGGLRCALDFSDFYLPDGVFQRLVPICAEFSARDGDSAAPRLSKSRARMSFGWTDFLLEARPREDRIEMVFKADAPGVGEAIKTIVSMFRELKDNVMGNLKWKLVLFSPRAPALAADYDALMRARAQRKAAFRGTAGERVTVADFDMFFDDEGAVGSFTADEHNGVVASTAAGEGSGERSGERGGAGRVVVGAVSVAAPRLPAAAQFHCFLSHKQSTGGDVAGLLFEKLQRNGLSVWYDEQMGELNKPSMRRGIEVSQCFLLFLSKSVFDSEYVCFELATALELGKRIILVHESDPKRASYADFGEYVDSVPKEASRLFERVESMPFQRRYYLEKGFLEELIARIAASCKE